MDAQERFERLADELAEFISNEELALREENWDYLKELLTKKAAHLQAMKTLEPQVNFAKGDLAARVKKLQAAEAANAKVMAEKLSAVKNLRDEVAGGLVRVKKLKTYAKGTRVPFKIAGRDTKGNFDASA